MAGSILPQPLSHSGLEDALELRDEHGGHVVLRRVPEGVDRGLEGRDGLVSRDDE